jgi:hypothetical protein
MDTSTFKLAGKVFIGHGHSPVWKDLRDFLKDRLHLEWTEFNGEPVAGYTTKERLEQMLAEASFAFLVMTAEEERSGGTLHARDNVIHEAGLFQGRLGFTRAIVLLEEGCSEFSNIVGLNQIRFPKGNVMAKSEDIREVLERELTRPALELVTTEIRFDYVPDKLTNHRWKPGYPDKREPEAAAYSSPRDAPVPGCLSIKTDVVYALDYQLPPTVCDRVRFDAQYSGTTMLFTGVLLTSKTGSPPGWKWIKYYISSGEIRAEPTPGSPNEYTLWWPAAALPNGWVSFDLSLPQVVQHTWGTQGWAYESLKAIRIRGSLSISPIRLTSSTSGAVRTRG